MFRRLASAALIGSVFLVAVSSAAAALPGDLDTTFGGGDGKVTTNFTTGFDSASTVLVQTDTKIVAVGMAAGSGGRFALVRYTSDGPLDTTGFGGGTGKVTTDFTSGYDAAFDGVLDAGDKIVAVGRGGLAGGRFALARYNTDGSLDTTFGGGDGKVMTNFTTGDDFAFGVAIQPSDGKIVVVGRAGGSGGVIALARYNADGTLDTDFGGGDGKVTTNITAGDDRVDAVALDPSEKIVVAGTANYFGANGRFAVARYNADGTPDTTFSGDGRLTTDFTTRFDGGFAVLVPPSGKIVAAGQAGGAVGLVSYNDDGTLDTAFGGGDGKVTTNFTAGADYYDDIVLDADGKIVAGGSANFFGPNSRFALARYNAVDGTLDTTFGGGDGKLITDFTTGFDGIYGVAVTSDAKIVAGGYAGGSGGRFAVARYAGG